MCSLPVLRLEAWALCSSWRLWKGILPCLLSAPGGYSITSTSAFIFMWLPVSLVCPWYVWLCNPVDCSPPGSSIHGILQARILAWVAIPFSGGSSQPGDWTQVSCIAGRALPSEPPGNPCFCASMFKLPSSLRTPVTGLWATLTQRDLTLLWLHVQRPDFSVRSHSQVVEVRTSMYLYTIYSSAVATGP